MSETGIDAYRVVSILGYCLLPMVGVGAVSVMFTLEYVYFSFACNIADYPASAGCWVICCHSFRLRGALSQLPASSWLSSGCQTSDCWLHTLLDCFMAVSPFSVFSTLVQGRQNDDRTRCTVRTQGYSRIHNEEQLNILSDLCNLPQVVCVP
jgi:hypothetical protein